MRVRPRVISDIRPAKPVAKPLKPAKQVHAPRVARTKVLKREVLKPGTVRRKRGFTTKSKLLTGMAGLRCIFGLGIGLLGLRTNHLVAAQTERLSKTEVAGASTDDNSGLPSEAKPQGTINDYHVAASLPRVLTIPSIDVHTRVVRTTVKANNQIGSPSNIFDAAWYDGSAKPGEGGTVLIDGHVSGPTQPGVFYKLNKLQVGSELEIERGDGKRISYSVVAKKVYDADKVDMGAVFNSAKPGQPALNIITCTGSVDETGEHFTQRLVVFAVQN